jgi:hypothetical protein
VQQCRTCFEREPQLYKGLPPLFQEYPYILIHLALTFFKMLFTPAFAILGALVSLTNATPLSARTSKKCFTKHTGQFLVDPGQPVGANKGLELIWPAAGRAITVSIQVRG